MQNSKNSIQRRQVPISEALKIAVEHQRAQRISQAEAIYRQVLAAEPNNSHALHLLGLVAYQTGDLGAARTLIERALAVRTDVPDYHANLGEVWRTAGDPQRAINCYQEALRLAPNLAEIRINLANALIDAGREKEAGEQYKQAGSGANVKEIHDMADKLERMNRLQGARLLSSRGLDLAPDHAGLNIIAARLDRREGAFLEGIARLKRIPVDQMDIHAAIQRGTELGRLYDRLNEADEAYDSFVSAGQLKSEMYRAKGISKDPALQEIASMEAVLTPEWTANWSAINLNESFERAAPVFLVGFPRSGTTLLEQVLSKHSQITTLEEKPLAEMLAKIVEQRYGNYPASIAGLSTADCLSLRQQYFQSADSLCRSAPGQVLVDKFPLNLVRLPLLARVFPDAKYIFALRHPFDAVLSGFMQNFTPNSAMANFCSVEDAALFYDRVMRIWRLTREQLSLPVHVIEYENVVSNFGGEVARLLEFLGLPWEDGVHTFSSSAGAGRVVNTPSYHQVAEPIYQRSSNRWLRYGPHLKSVENILTPWIEYFDYGDPQ